MAEATQKRKKITVFVSALVVVAVALGIGYALVRETPRYSLYRFKKAVLERDAEAALQYLDTDRIVDNMARELSAGGENKEDQPNHGPGASMRNVGRDIFLQNLSTIKEQLRDQLKSAIISYDDQNVLDNLKKANVLGLNITTEGDTALVKIRGKDKVAFRMAKSSEGYWKIVALNLKELGVDNGK